MGTVILGEDGQALECYDREDFIAETLEYRYNKGLRDLLTSQWLQQKTPAQAIAYIREKAGARTEEEKAQSRRPVGRPRLLLTSLDAQKRIAMAVLKTVCDLESRDMQADTRQILEGVKRQALQQLGGA